MSRIAIISDIHSNLPALEAVLSDIKKQNIDTIYCLGDIIGKGPSPSECLDLCKAYCTKSILGNWEDFLLRFDIDEDPIRYYRKNISVEQVNWLHSLDYGIEFYLSGHLVRLFHAHPHDVYCRVFGRSSLTLHAEMFDVPSLFRSHFPDQRTQVAIYGDIHYAYSTYFDEDHFKKHFEADPRSYIFYKDFCQANKDPLESTQGRWLINTGSVGQPFDGTKATYVILEGDLDSEIKGDFSFSIERVSYDNHLAAEIALCSTMYDKEEYTHEILTGIYRGLHKEKS